MASSNLKGIVGILLAVAAFAVMDATMKHLGEHYSPLQVTSLRGFASLPFFLLLGTWQRRWHELLPARWSLHVLRALLSIGMLWLFIYSLRTLSLSSAYAVILCAPLLITAISVPLLRERVDWQRWVAIVVGLLGVLIMIRPNASEVQSLGALAAFAAAVCYSFMAILIRVASRTETTLSLSISFVVLIAPIAGALAWPNWQPIQIADIAWIVTLGLSGSIGQYFLIDAFRRAPASVVAPFDYTALLWGALLDWILWRTLPDTKIYLGGALVVATGLYLIYQERAANRSPSGTGA